jgi:hypothetical protein
MNDDTQRATSKDGEPRDDDTVTEQLLWEIEVLKSRVAELEVQLDRVTKQRDAALTAFGGGHPADVHDEGIEIWKPTNTCRYCDGEGVIWVHDFRMDCKRCGGSGITRGDE